MLLPASSLRPGADLDAIRKAFDDGEGAYLWFGPEPALRCSIVPPDAVAELREAWLQAIRDHPIDMIEHRLLERGLRAQPRPSELTWSNDPPADPAIWGFDYTIHPHRSSRAFYSWVEGTVATWGRY